MKIAKLILVLPFMQPAVIWATPPYELPLIKAIAEIESGHDDITVGKKGEVSRYQILPTTWKKHAPKGVEFTPKNYTNHIVASAVCNNYVSYLQMYFASRNHRIPNES